MCGQSKTASPTEGRATAAADVDSVAARLGRLTRWPSREARDWVERFVLAASRDASTAAVVMFGSIARPVDKAQDVDLLYVYWDGKMQLPGRPLDVDLLAFRAADVASLVAGGHDLTGWAVKYGYLVYERDGFWTRLVEELLPELPLPSAAEADRRAGKAAALSDELRRMGDLDAANEQRIVHLTHLARARLLSRGIYPASRPELPDQLLQVSEHELARLLSGALRKQDEEQR